MKNPFLTLLEDPASLITIEFDNAEKEMIVQMLEEKVKSAIAMYDNPEQHDDAIYGPFNEWLYYLNEMWDGKLNYTFEQWAYTIGLQKYELYKMILGLLADKHLDYVCEQETDIDDDTLEDINSQYDYPANDEYWTPSNIREALRAMASKSGGDIDNDTLDALKINR